MKNKTSKVSSKLPEGSIREKLERGQPLEELVKGSLDYTMNEIRAAFRNQFSADDGMGNMTMPWYINEIFADHVIVSTWMSSNELKIDEYYKVTYSKNGESYVFADREAWEIVELAYQPQTSGAIGESIKSKGKKKGVRFDERIDGRIALQEAEEGKPRKIKIEGAITADVVNGNGRRYPSSVLEAAIAELRGHLNESAGQGRAVQVLGEAEHPSDKGGRPNFLETVVKWDEVSFDGQHVDLVGHVLETSKGRDILTLMEGGVMPGASLRGYGDGKTTGKGEDKVFEVRELHLTGFDLVLEPSFENSAELIESIHEGETEMTLEELMKLMKDHPELFEGLNEAQIKKMGETQLKALEDKIREALGVDEKANIAEALKGNVEKARKFDELQAKASIDAAITEATKELPFGKKLNEMFITSLKEANCKTADEVKQFAESKNKEYSQLAAAGVLKGMGFKEGKSRLQVIGDVLEEETGTPSFARTAFELTESIRKHENKAKSAIVLRAESPASVYTQLLLKRFDKIYKAQLMAESQAFEEAELTTDLNLPYSVSRAIIEEAFPNLVAANIFDVGTIETSPTRLYYETTTGETGYTVEITDEVETGGVEETWYALSHGRITPGSVTVTSNPAGTTYVEGTDYVINYADGKIKFLSAGSVNANDVLVDYTYSSIRNGEMAPIERVKTTLTFKIIEAAADRLADQISREAIVFSRSQLGWDAVARTMANLVRQMRRKIDQGLLYMAFSAVKSVANNDTDAWTRGTAQADYAELVRLLGVASVIVANRPYEPTFYLSSVTNADELSNWEGFMRTGFPNALLNAAGFAGMVKGKPIFASTEFPDTLWIAGNRELVQHRVYLPLSIKGPFPTYDVSGGTSKIVAADQYYAEEFNATESLVSEKGAFVPVQEPSS